MLVLDLTPRSVAYKRLFCLRSISSNSFLLLEVIELGTSRNGAGRAYSSSDAQLRALLRHIFDWYFWTYVTNCCEIKHET